MDACLVLTTVDHRATADALSREAVTRRLAACAQVGSPVTSTYRWRGVLESAQEFTVQFKTVADRVDELIAYVREAHPYEVPEILVTPVIGGDPAYLAWLHDETRQH